MCIIKVVTSKGISDVLTVLLVGKLQDLGCHLSSAPTVCRHEGLNLRETHALSQVLAVQLPQHSMTIEYLNISDFGGAPDEKVEN